MCGIAGAFAYAAGAPPVDRAALRRVRAAMACRGPDGAGAWWSPDGRIGLAHRRLAIIDLDTRAAQPMVAASHDLVLVCNGEIYNYRSLRSALAALGLTFATASDTEVLLMAYVAWGRDLFARLQGMYAFALWDGRRGGLLLGRDPYGIKPLYYADTGATLRLASQVKALQAGGSLGSADPAGLVGFLLTGSVPEPHTLWSEAHALPAGHALWVDAAGPGVPWAHAAVAGVWAAAGAARAADAGVAPIHAALRESVRRHQVADVAVGAFLSAGIDSGALVGLMAESSPRVQTLTLGFAEFRGTPRDETPGAERTAAHFATHHQTHWIDAAAASRDLPTAVAAMDQPSVDGINTWLVSRAAHQAGLKVAISGVGGDELFGGYGTFAELAHWRTWQGRLARLPGARALGAALLRSLAGWGWVHPRVPGLVALDGSDAAYYLVRRGLFMPWELPALLAPEVVQAGLRALQPPAFLAVGAAPDADAFVAMAALEASNYLRNQLLRDSDWASMAHSLELRVPLVDYTLLTTIAPLLAAGDPNRPPRGGGKALLAQAPALGLPVGLARRPKTGFGIPMERWLAGCAALDGWRGHPWLAGPRVHWSRRLAYVLLADALGSAGDGRLVGGGGR